MRETDRENGEIEGVPSRMNVVAQGSIETSDANLDRVLTEFTEDELIVMQPTDTCSGGRGTCEIRVDEAETLSRFYEACDEHGIICSIRRLYHQ